jgi:hypothetical protein
MVKHISKGGYNSDRISIGQYKIHRAAPDGAESPLVLEGAQEASIVNFQHASYLLYNTYVVNGEFIEWEKVSILSKHSHD